MAFTTLPPGRRHDRRKRPQTAPLHPVDIRLLSFVGMITLLFLLAQMGIYVVISKRIDDKNLSFLRTEKEAFQKIVGTVARAIPPKWRSRHAAVDQSDHDIRQIQHTFPVHVGDDMEIIDHPGVLMSNTTLISDVLARHPDLQPKVRVPRFWNPVGAYGPNGVRGFLGNNGERLITPEEAAKIGSFDSNGRETIYVSIAAYRDPECGPTVTDLFERAAYPERIRVAIIDQRLDEDPICDQPPKPCEQDPLQTLCKYRHLIESFEQPAQFSVGPCYARHLAHRMYRGEYFAMQVDSHVRFTQDWDDSLVTQWRSAKNEMGVLSVYLSDLKKRIDPETHKSVKNTRPIMCDTIYEGSGKYRHIRHDQQPEGASKVHGEPTFEPLWAAGFSFARGHFVVQVPYDQYLPMVFQGEEISIGVRGFSYGYDYYAPERPVLFHIYHRNKTQMVKGKFWENEDLFPDAGIAGMVRLNAIIKTGNPDDPYFTWQEHEYGLGKVRDIQKFYTTFGIHTETQTVEKHLCKLIGKKLHDIFRPTLRENRMGMDYDKVDYVFEDPDPDHDDKVDDAYIVEVRQERDKERLKNPESFVGARIEVKYSNGYYYKAKITDYDSDTRRHSIKFDDGYEHSFDISTLVMNVLRMAKR